MLLGAVPGALFCAPKATFSELFSRRRSTCSPRCAPCAPEAPRGRFGGDGGGPLGAPSGSPLDHPVLRFTVKAAEVAFLAGVLQYSAFGPKTRPLKLSLWDSVPMTQADRNVEGSNTPRGPLARRILRKRARELADSSMKFFVACRRLLGGESEGGERPSVGGSKRGERGKLH